METEQPASFELNGVAMYLPRVFADTYDIPIQTVYSAVSSDRITAHRQGGRLFLVASSADNYAEIYKATKGSS